MKSLLKIQSIDDGKMIEKIGKWLLELRTSRGPELFWLSEKQAAKLFETMNMSSAYPTFPTEAPRAGVFAAFEQRGEYFNFIWAGGPKDCDWLRQTFGPFDQIDEGPAATTKALPAPRANVEIEEEEEEEDEEEE